MGRGAGSGQGHTRQCQYFESVHWAEAMGESDSGAVAWRIESDPPAGVGDNAKKMAPQGGCENNRR